jgi:putative DNA primase/helicase
VTPENAKATGKGGPATIEEVHGEGTTESRRTQTHWADTLTSGVADPLAVLSDLRNCEVFLAQHGEDVRYVNMWGKWYVWDGGRWKADHVARVMHLVKMTVRGMYAECGAIEDADKRTRLAKWAARSEAAWALGAIEELARSSPVVAREPSAFDRDPWLLNCLNGTLDLKTGKLRAARREDAITKQVPVNYDPGATCPKWLAFLNRVMAGDDAMIAYLQSVVAYTMTGSTDERCLFILHGSGNNGKSIFTMTLAELMGDYGTRTATETLLQRRQGGIPNDVAALRGARYVYAAEAEEGCRLAEAKVKDITGGDRITARFLHAEFFEFTPEFKLFLSTNHKPVIRGTDHAIWNRIRLIPFEVTIPKAEQIPQREMMANLRAELPGILRWAADALPYVREHGIGVSDKVAQATRAYRLEQDVLANFIDERCAVAEDNRVAGSVLYASYINWCTEAQEQPLSRNMFGRGLTERGMVQDKRHGERWWRGLGLLAGAQ